MTAAKSVSWQIVARDAFGMWLATRLILVVATYFTVVLNLSPHSASGYVIGTHTPSDLASAWFRWDAHWYLQISAHGYFSQRSTAFFPLYPLLIEAVTAPFGEGARWAAALVISNLAALAAFIAVGFLGAAETGQRGGGARAVLVLAAYPLAFFLAAPYTESLFVALAALTLLAARGGAWGLTAAAAAAASLSRPIGVILVAPIVIELIRQHGWPAALLRPSRIAALLSVPSGISAFAAYQWWRFGDPLLFLKVQSIYWKRHAMAPWDTFRVIADHLVHDPFLGGWQAELILDLALLLAGAAFTLLALRSQPLSLTAYTVLLLITCIVSPNLSNLNPVSSVGRFLVAAIPVFIYVGQAMRRRPWLETVVVGGGFTLQAVLATLYLSGAWLE